MLWQSGAQQPEVPSIHLPGGDWSIGTTLAGK
jgi:hypothetical protein